MYMVILDLIYLLSIHFSLIAGRTERIMRFKGSKRRFKTLLHNFSTRPPARHKKPLELLILTCHKFLVGMERGVNKNV